MVQEGWICPRCGKVNAPWVIQCSCNMNTQILPKVGAPYYEGDQATCNHKEDKQWAKKKAIDKINQAIFLIKPYFEGNLEAKRFTLKYLQDSLKELEE